MAASRKSVKSRKDVQLPLNGGSDDAKTIEYLEAPLKHLGQSFRFVRELGGGKTGKTYVIQAYPEDVRYCLKTISPDVPREKLNELRLALEKEVQILKPLHHRVFPKIIKDGTRCSLPYYVCTFHPGMTFRAFKEAGHKLTRDQAAFVICELIDAMAYLHKCGRTHCDFHTNNIMISADTYQDGILIIDFGSGHRESDSSRYTVNAGDYRFKQVDGQQFARQPVDRQAFKDQFVMSDFRALADLLGTMKDVFFCDAPHDQQEAYSRLCHDLRAGAVTDWAHTRQRIQLLIDPTRLMNHLRRLFLLPGGAARHISIPVSGRVAVGEKTLAVINCRQFQRLRFIKQLSFCEWSFPGGTHSRFEHSLGVMELTTTAATMLASHSDFGERFSLREIDALVLASLVHDIGHYPFAHVLEHYIASRFDGPSLKDIKQSIHHVPESIRLITGDTELRAEIIRHWGEDTLNDTTRILQGHGGALTELIDGPLDCDKLDYLRRDALHCGVPYGYGVNVSSILDAIRLDGTGSSLAMHESAIAAVEGFVVAQDQMLSTVYWHPTIRGVIAMFHAFVAAIAGASVDKLVRLVTQLKSCQSETEAIYNVLLPSLNSLTKPKREQCEPLIRLLYNPSYSDIYKPIAKYTRADALPPKARHNIYDSIMVQVSTDIETSYVPVKWSVIKELRRCFIAAFTERAGASPPVGEFEVLVDVPWGKSSNRIVSVVDTGGNIRKITEVSHLRPTIFTDPTAYLAPIRVFVSPRVYDQYHGVMKAVLTSAEERFHSMEFKDPSETQL